MTLAGGSALALVIKVLGQVFFTGYTIFLARILSQGDYGTVMYAITLVTVLSPVCLLGFDRTVLKFAAMYWVERDFSSLRGLLRRGRVTGTVCSVALFLPAVALLILKPFQSLSGVGESIILAVVVLPFWTWVSLTISFLRGIKRLVPALTGFYIFRPLLATFFTAVAYWYGYVTPVHVLALLACALLVIMIIDAYQIRKALNLSVHKPEPRYESREWNATARPLLFSLVMSTVMNRADMLMVGWLLGVEAAALYAVAFRLAVIPSFVLDAVRVVISPMISEHHYKNDLRSLQENITEASQWIFWATVPLAGTLLLFPQFFLGLFGEVYKSGVIVLVCLTVGQLINALAGTVQPLLAMTSHQKALAKMLLVSTIIYLVLNFVLIKRLGLEGAALATALTMIIRNAWMVIYIKRELSVVSYVTFDRNFFRNLFNTGLVNRLRNHKM